MHFKKKTGLAVALALSSSTLFAVPKTVTEPVPMENSVILKLSETEEGKAAFALMTSLPTYQDSENPNKYYYFPAYFPSRSINGAATVVANKSAVERRSRISELSNKIQLVESSLFMDIRGAYSELTKKRRNPDLTPDEIRAIDASRLALKQELEALNKEADENQTGLPNWILNSFYNRMADLFGLSGFPISLADIKDTNTRGQTLAKLSSSNGGFFSGNLIAGFTADEIKKIRYYKKVRAELGYGEIKLVKLPVKNIKFQGLSETYSSSQTGDTQESGIPLFRNFKASGSLTAASYNFDLTLDGAQKFSVAPPPINVPIGVTAELLVRPPKYIATLDCDFTNGWTIKGRTDIKDGLIIYNNDIFSSMVAEDISQTNKPCTITATGGSGSAKELAYTEALNHLQTRFDNLFFHRTELAYKDKMAYWNGVQQDIASNRHRGANSGWSGLFTRARSLGFVGTLIGGFSNASRFYWHTDVRNIKALSKVKFSKRIVLDENKLINVSLGTTDMCLAYNVDRKIYVPCDEVESRSEQSVTDSANEAENSCITDETIVECRDYRENGGADTNDKGNIKPKEEVKDPTTELPDEL